MATTAETIAQQSLTASYSEIQEALTQKTIPDWFIQDYINKQQNIDTIAGSTTTLETQVATNTTSITANTGNITTNATNIGTNATNITTNATNIGTNTAGITTNATNLTTHEGLAMAHGVLGVNVGTLNFAQALTGGVVLLAAKVTDATQISTAIVTADVGTAPVTYDQTYAQSQTDLINENKATINNLVTDVTTLTTQLNAFLAAVQTAKQMSTA